VAELADSVAVAVASGQRPAGESSRLPKRLAGFAELLLQLADGIHGETGRILDAGAADVGAFVEAQERTRTGGGNLWAG